MRITEYLKDNILYLDGGMGTLLQEAGLKPGEKPESWNITRPEVITEQHARYFSSGANVVLTNTFGANILKFSEDELEKIISSGIACARAAAISCSAGGERWVAFDMGPTGRMLKPYGDLNFEDAVAIFKKSAALAEKHGADLIFIETMSDSYETKAALLAAKEATSLPVFVSNAYGEDGKLMTGADAAAMVALLEGLGADAIGVNCSLGPKALAPIVEKYLELSSLPVIVKPNAGLPSVKDGKTVYDVAPRAFAEELISLIKLGARVVGGCCGTTPEYIAALHDATKDITPPPVAKKDITIISSHTHALIFGDEPILIGERINPTGKRRLKEALREHDVGYILGEGISEEERGAHVLDVNVGLPEIDEGEMLEVVVTELQAVLDLPLQIDTADSVAMERALRVYNGKPMINSVNGKRESMEKIFPLAKKYGGLVVALTLDENGIPETAEERLQIAEKILLTAMEYGIDKKNLIFDPLAMTVSADRYAARETLRAVRLIHDKLGCHTSLGVSNSSFGLPARDTVSAAFFSLALEAGMSAAIMNPHSDEMMRAYYTWRMLHGLDESCRDYIGFAEAHPTEVASTATRVPANTEYQSELQRAIIKGLKREAASLTEALIKEREPLEIVNGDIIPALNTVGEGFEKKTVYLPGLLMSAEAAEAAFEVIKSHSDAISANKCTIVLATVRGDIHDIGKNIVKLILENYGFRVVDLGRDVPPERIVSEAVRLGAPIVGLSALMTTTVPAMEETIKQLRIAAPECRVIVGGAVLTEKYAATIGADKYAADAMEAVRYAESINEELKA